LLYSFLLDLLTFDPSDSGTAQCPVSLYTSTKLTLHKAVLFTITAMRFSNLTTNQWYGLTLESMTTTKHVYQNSIVGASTFSRHKYKLLLTVYIYISFYAPVNKLK
jgi:hypothetical protein